MQELRNPKSEVSKGRLIERGSTRGNLTVRPPNGDSRPVETPKFESRKRLMKMIGLASDTPQPMAGCG